MPAFRRWRSSAPASTWTIAIRAQISELAHWFRDSDLKLHSLHAPMYTDEIWGRSGPQSVITITETVKAKRIAMVDEIKRAIEIAETIPFRYLIQHIGVGGEEYDERKLDAAFSALEELSVFAGSAASRSCSKTFPTRSRAPSAWCVFLDLTHLKLNFVFDVGHANIGEGVETAFSLMKRSHPLHPRPRQRRHRTTYTCLRWCRRAGRWTGPAPCDRSLRAGISIRWCWSSRTHPP